MSTTSNANNLRYCRKKNTMCQKATEYGECSITACTNHNPVYSMCDTCRHNWSKRFGCDINKDPNNCDSWAPD